MDVTRYEDAEIARLEYTDFSSACETSCLSADYSLQPTLFAAIVKIKIEAFLTSPAIVFSRSLRSSFFFRLF
jgi:hypothetical protein